MEFVNLRSSIISCIVFCCLIPVVRAQNHYFTHYEVENGLSNNTVTCSLIDKKGFMWFGTRDGLNRFDGYTFKQFRHNPVRAKSIGNNIIFALYQDIEGNLWVGTEQGLYKYDYDSESFSFLKTSSKMPVRIITEDKNRNLWYIAGYKLYSVDQSGMIRFYPKVPQATTMCFAEDKLWVGTQRGELYQYDANKELFRVFMVVDDSRKPYWVQTLFADSTGKIYIGTSGESVKIFDTHTLKLRNIISPKNGLGIFTRAIIRRSAEELWIGTESGIIIYNERTRKCKYLRRQYNDPYSLSDNSIYTLCKDREGGIWVGTYFGGINYFPEQYTYFQKFYPKTAQNSLSGNAISQICEDFQGNIWIGTEDAGLNKLDHRLQTFDNFQPSDGKSGLAFYNITALLPIGKELWIGTFENGLDIMNIERGKVVRHYDAGPKPNQLGHNFIYCMLRTSGGSILLGTASGLYRYNNQHDDFTKITGLPANAFITKLTEDSDGNVWVAVFSEGLFSFKINEGRISNPAIASSVNNKLNNGRITGIMSDRDDELWITTESGLLRCKSNGTVVKRYSVADGLPSDLIYNILEAEDGKLWLSTSGGLVAFDKKTGKNINFTTSDGLLSNQFNYNSAFKDSRGTLYFGSVKGLIGFNPSRFVRLKFTPPVYITSFQVNNKEINASDSDSILKRSIIVTQHLCLDHKQSTFSIDFSALSFTSPESIEYAYKMEGLDDHWTFIRKNRRTYFTELPPGNYVFKVKAVNRSHNWTTDVRSLSIQIVPPFWKSSSAYFIYVFIIVSSLYGASSSYKRKLIREHRRQLENLESRKEKEVYEAKIDFFTNVAHEIRTPLTLIRIPMENLIKRSNNDPDIEKYLQTMNRNTQRLLSLTNHLLDFRRTETSGYSLNFVKTNISDLLEEIWANFQSAADQRNLYYNLVIPPALIVAYIDREAFTKILSNLLDNGIKYGITMLVLELKPSEISDETFKITVSSDGKPLSADLRELVFEPFVRSVHDSDKEGKGIGLALARSLAELHHGYLNAIEVEGNYNVFVLELPIHQLFEFNLQGRWKKR